MPEFKRNSDGSVIVVLDTPVTLRGEEITRVTIPALKGKHLMRAPFKGADIAIGQLVEFAGTLVIPEGAIEEMTVQDALAIATEVASMLGKAPRTGAEPLPV